MFACGAFAKFFPMAVCWNGKLTKENEISLAASDAVFLRGEGVFETIRAEAGVPCLWEKHYARLVGSARRMGWVAPEKELLRAQIVGLLESNQLLDARVRITLGNNYLITAGALPAIKEPLSVVTSDCPVNERSPLTSVKCTSYAENMLLLRESGADEAIRPNMAGDLCEGCISNVFFVKDGGVFTPSLKSGCLPGVMRSEVMRVAKVTEGQWPFEIIHEADELWLSNSLRGVRHVHCLNGRDLGQESSLLAQIRQRLAQS